jgi:hypothetical protein
MAPTAFAAEPANPALASCRRSSFQASLTSRFTD